MVFTERDLIEATASQPGRLPQGSRGIYQKIWQASVKVLQREVQKGRRVTLPGIGSVSATEGDVAFVPAARFVAAGGLRTESVGAGFSSSETEVKSSVISRSLGIDAEICKRGYEDLYETLCQAARNQSSLSLNLGVGRVQISNGAVTFQAIGGGKRMSAPLSARVSSSRSAISAGGRSVASDPLSARAASAGARATPALSKLDLVGMRGNYANLTNEQIEATLAGHAKRGDPTKPLSARDIAEANLTQLQSRVQDEERQRLRSRDEARGIVSLEQQEMVREAKKLAHRRDEQTRLAESYKKAIAQRERNRFRKHEDLEGPPVDHFPWVHGESLEGKRQDMNNQRMSDMKRFLEESRAKQPSKVDPIRAAASHEYTAVYPAAAPTLSEEAHARRAALARESEAQFPEHPRVLERATVYNSRRMGDDHVKKAMRDRIERDTDNLVNTLKQRQNEEDKMLQGRALADALQQSGSETGAEQRVKVQSYLKQQMVEKEERKRAQRVAEVGRDGGYFGPDEKNVARVALHQNHQEALRQQMEIDRSRRLESRHRRMEVENRIVDNAHKSLQQDAVREISKQERSKQALLQMWEHQIKHKQVKTGIDSWW